MNILVLFIADGLYAEYAKRIIVQFRSNITNPEGHSITFRIDPPNNDFDYLEFWGGEHKGRRISLSRFKYIDDSEFDRIIYLDSDMEIVGNVDYLLSEELNSREFWACHVHGYDNYYGDSMKRFGLSNDDIINGGLQVWNKPILTRQMHNVIMDYLATGLSFDGSDQGYISYLLKHNVFTNGWIPDEYNFCHQDPFHPVVDKPKILHYTGNKPWSV
jgi:lipopolysaccharide biosynthesis glycosyltransferase